MNIMLQKYWIYSTSKTRQFCQIMRNLIVFLVFWILHFCSWFSINLRSYWLLFWNHEFVDHSHICHVLVTNLVLNALLTDGFSTILMLNGTVISTPKKEVIIWFLDFNAIALKSHLENILGPSLSGSSTSLP